MTNRFTPEDYGAVGDGTTNDSLALKAMAEAVNQAGGGLVEFSPGATYLIGIQALNGGTSGYNYTWDPVKVMEFIGCSLPLILRGNGCRIKCRSGLKYGTFDSAGNVVNPTMPYYGTGIASPYTWMIKVENCSGFVDIDGFELDGSINDQTIGGQWGDTGRQLPATGLGLFNNSGGEKLANILSHHHGQDGFILDGVSPDAASLQTMGNFVNVHAHRNGRQGLSIVGGTGYTLTNCKFNYTGKDLPFYSPPGAGVDIEAENKKVRDLSFIRCEFVCNSGCGMVADQGDSENVTFHDCKFVGDTNWAAWPRKPRMKFYACTFVGASLAYGSPDPDKATQFHDCRFVDDPAQSPTGQVFDGGSTSSKTILDCGGSGENVLMKGCTVALSDDMALPYGGGVMIFDTVNMSQTTTARVGYPRGKYRGVSAITGLVDLAYSNFQNCSLTVNGVSVPASPFYLGHLSLQGIDSTHSTYVKVREGNYNNPLHWVTFQINAANVGDRVRITHYSPGQPAGYICKTAPGNLQEHWVPTSYFPAHGKVDQNAGTLNAGASAFFDCPVTGAAVGDHCIVSASPDLGDNWEVSARINGSGNARIRLQNISAGSLSPGTATFRVVAQKPVN